MVRIKELRIKADKTQQEMADIFNVNRTTYTKWETDTHKPDVETLLKLAAFFNVSTDYLLEITNNPLPMDKQKEPDPEWGSFEWLRKGLIARGTIKDGEDLTDEQLSIAFQNLDNLVKILSKQTEN